MKDRRNSDERLLALEKSLKSQLYPVKPDREFVGVLHQRLQDSPIYLRRKEKAATLLTIAAGLSIGLVIFLIGKQIIQYLEEA